MPKLPSISGRDLVRALEKLGFRETGGCGSHVKLRRGEVTCVVPLHSELKRGTLAGVLRQAGVTPDELVEAMTR